MSGDLDQSKGAKEPAYPLFDLEPCITFAAAIKELGGAKAPIKKSMIARHVGLAESTPSFFQKLSSARAYGIIDGRGSYQLTDIGRAFFFPKTEGAKTEIGLKMLGKPPVFAHIIRKFDGDKLPANSILGNILHEECGVPESWKDRLALFFVRSAQYLGIIDNAGILRYDAGMHDTPKTIIDREVIGTSAEAETEAHTSGVEQVTKFPRRPPAAAPGHTAWAFPCKGQYIRVETPEEMPLELWQKLNAYVQILKPIQIQEEPDLQ